MNEFYAAARQPTAEPLLDLLAKNDRPVDFSRPDILHPIFAVRTAIGMRALLHAGARRGPEWS